MKSMNVESWMNDKKVTEWLKLINTKKTVYNYKREFPIFMQFVVDNTEYKMPTEIIESRMKQQKSDDMNIRRFWESTGIKFMHELESKEFKPNTIRSYLRTMLSFFSKNYIPLAYSRNELFGSIRAVGKGKSNPISKAWIPTKDDIKILFRFAESSRDKAITLTLFQSGVSEVEISEMLIQDFNFYDENNKWIVPMNEHLYWSNERTKSREIYQTCISSECLESIRDMLQSRGYPTSGYLFVSFRNKKIDTRIVNSIFKGENTRKGIVEKAFNGRVKDWQTKNLRDAYMNCLEMAKIPQKVADLMSGHKPSGARANYVVSPETIKMAYADAFKFLSINGASAHVKEIAELQSDFQKTKNELIDLITELRVQNKVQAEKVNTIENNFNELKSEIQRIEKSELDKKEQITKVENMLLAIKEKQQSKDKELANSKEKEISNSTNSTNGSA